MAWILSIRYAEFIIIIIRLTSIFFQDQSRVWTAASQQHKVDNKPVATFLDFSFSRSDASIFKKIPSSCMQNYFKI